MSAVLIEFNAPTPVHNPACHFSLRYPVSVSVLALLAASTFIPGAKADSKKMIASATAFTGFMLVMDKCNYIKVVT